jgi:hypothetical protein
MAKLIGHYYSKKKGEYIVFEVDGLKETPKQFSKTPETAEGKRPAVDYWAIMPKTQLGELRREYAGYTLYNLQEDLLRFKELVIADLEQKSVAKKIEYDNALADLRRAQSD